MKKNVARIGLLLLLILIGMAFYFLLQKGATETSAPNLDLGNVGKDVACMNNLREVRHALAAYMADHHNNLPRSLNDLSAYGITPEMLKCPVGGEPYLYSEGTAKCPHPGHERY